MPRLLPLLVLVAAIAFAVSPFLSNGFGGYRPDQFPIPQADPPIQPAGWAFSIWGLIYAWLVAGSAFGLWKRAADPDWQPMRPALLVSLALGAFWIETAHRTPTGATVLIVAMLVPALAAFLPRLTEVVRDIGPSEVRRALPVLRRLRERLEEEA